MERTSTPGRACRSSSGCRVAAGRCRSCRRRSGSGARRRCRERAGFPGARWPDRTRPDRRSSYARSARRSSRKRSQCQSSRRRPSVAVSVPPRWPAPDCRTATSTLPSAIAMPCGRFPTSIRRVTWFVRGSMTASVPPNLLLTQTRPRPDGDRHWAVPGRSDRCDLSSSTDRSERRFRRGCSRPTPRRGRRRFPQGRFRRGSSARCARRRVDACHLTRRALGRPQGSGAEGELSGGDRQRPRAACRCRHRFS